MFKYISRRGVSVRKVNILMVIIAGFISIALFVAMQYTSRLFSETLTLTRQMVGWSRSAYDMQDASDYLTEQIRSFVVSGDRLYLDNYFEEAKVTMRREKALKNLSEYHGNNDAYNSLAGAMEESVSLMDLEYHAAKLAAIGYGYDESELPEEVRNVSLSSSELLLSDSEKRSKAEELLFGESYRHQKDLIANHMQSCLSQLSSSLEYEQNDIFEQLERQVFLEHLLTLLLIGVLLVIVAFVSSQVLVPLKQAVDFVRRDQDIPLTGAYELRFLEKNYNVMYQMNREKKEKLVYEASHDKLTGLYNRRGYEFLLDNLDIETSAILMVDLDKFKDVNDTFGHDIGDKVIIRVANSLRKNFGEEAYICRLGGDEFVVIMVKTGKKDRDTIEKKVNRINERLQKKKNDVPPVSISVGVTFGQVGKTMETIFKEADIALYQAKDRGRSGICFYRGA